MSQGEPKKNGNSSENRMSSRCSMTASHVSAVVNGMQQVRLKNHLLLKERTLLERRFSG